VQDLFHEWSIFEQLAYVRPHRREANVFSFYPASIDLRSGNYGGMPTTPELNCDGEIRMEIAQ
jgi:hypothetical protein